MIKVYLSGPINSPIPDLTSEDLKARFNDLQKWLKRNYGHWEVVNPLEVAADCGGTCGGSLDGHSWSCWLKYDLIAMMDCEAICMLPGWQDSRGANLEVYVAEKIGMSPYYALLNDSGGWRIA